MGTFQTIDHTADIAIEIRGNSLEDLFQTAYLAWYETVLGQMEVHSKVRKSLKLQADSPEELLVNFISELNFWLMAKKWITTRIDKLELAKADGQLILHMMATGQLLDLKKHELQVEVKAVTFHQMEIKQSGNKFFTRLVFDV